MPLNFKGPDAAVAGNLHRWATPWDVLHDPEVRELLEAEIQDTVTRDGWEASWGFELELIEVAGWATTLPLGGLPWNPDPMLRVFEPRKGKTKAFQITNPEVLAPKTHVITLVVNLREQGNDVLCLVQSMYPGPHVELAPGRIHPEQAVFFAWGHPGEPLEESCEIPPAPIATSVSPSVTPPWRTAPSRRSKST